MCFTSAYVSRSKSSHWQLPVLKLNSNRKIFDNIKLTHGLHWMSVFSRHAERGLYETEKPQELIPKSKYSEKRVQILLGLFTILLSFVLSPLPNNTNGRKITLVF